MRLVGGQIALDAVQPLGDIVRADVGPHPEETRAVDGMDALEVEVAVGRREAVEVGAGDGAYDDGAGRR